MANTSTRQIAISFVGDFDGNETYAATPNTTAPGQTGPIALAMGDNVIAVPGAGTVPKAVTIIPPSGNTLLIKAKGTTADAGISLHKTDPTSIALDTTVTSVVFNAAGAVNVRLVWT